MNGSYRGSGGPSLFPPRSWGLCKLPTASIVLLSKHTDQMLANKQVTFFLSLNLPTLSLKGKSNVINPSIKLQDKNNLAALDNKLRLPVKDGEKRLTLTAAVRHCFHMEAAILDRTISTSLRGTYYILNMGYKKIIAGLSEIQGYYI